MEIPWFETMRLRKWNLSAKRNCLRQHSVRIGAFPLFHDSHPLGGREPLRGIMPEAIFPVCDLNHTSAIYFPKNGWAGMGQLLE